MGIKALLAGSSLACKFLSGTTFVGHSFSASRVERTELPEFSLPLAGSRNVRKTREKWGAAFHERKESWPIERRTQSTLNAAAGS